MVALLSHICLRFVQFHCLVDALFLEVTLLPKMSEKDKKEAEKDDINRDISRESFKAHA